MSGNPGYLTPNTGEEIRDHARHWAEQDASLFAQMLLGNLDLDLESKTRQTLTFRLKKEIGEAIRNSYWHELAVPFIQAIPSLQTGVWRDEDHADEVAAHSGGHADTDTLFETEADGLIEETSSSEREGVASPVQADEIGGYYSVKALAQKHDVPLNALDQKLRRFRKKNPFGCNFIEDKAKADTSTKTRSDPRYVYFEPAVIHRINELKKRQKSDRKQREMLQFGDP